MIVSKQYLEDFEDLEKKVFEDIKQEYFLPAWKSNGFYTDKDIQLLKELAETKLQEAIKQREKGTTTKRSSEKIFVDPLPELYKFEKNELTEEPQKQEGAARYNQGKIQYNLIPPYPLEQLGKLFTYGATKYAPNNWKKGLLWTKVLDSAMRHLEAFRAGEDYDYDRNCQGCIEGYCKNHSGVYNLTAATWNLFILTDYYKSNPQFDDRVKSYLKLPKIVLDIDEVVCGWGKGYTEYTGKRIQSSFWDSRYGFSKELDELAQNKEFWLDLPVIRKPDFVPHAYVSSRSIPVEWTQEWLEKNELPCRPVYHVPFNTSKVEVLKEIGAEFFIDDRFENFIEVQNSGICSFLMDAKHNQFYDVGYKRIYDLQLRNIIRA